MQFLITKNIWAIGYFSSEKTKNLKKKKIIPDMYDFPHQSSLLKKKVYFPQKVL